MKSVVGLGDEPKIPKPPEGPDREAQAAADAKAAKKKAGFQRKRTLAANGFDDTIKNVGGSQGLGAVPAGNKKFPNALGV